MSRGPTRVLPHAASWWHWALLAAAPTVTRDDVETSGVALAEPVSEPLKVRGS